MRSKIKVTTISIAIALYTSYINANENIIIDTNKSGILSLSKIDGIDTLDIEKANTTGVSHNYYTKFNVSKEGLKINNPLSNDAANIIINEVTSLKSNNISQLKGNIEINGKQASLIIVNPNGIECDGCSFTNSPSTYLTAGHASYFKDKDRNDAIKLSPKYDKKINFKAFSNIIPKTGKLTVIGHSIEFSNSGHTQGQVNLLSGGQDGYIRKSGIFSEFKKPHRGKSNGKITFKQLDDNGLYNFIKFNELNIISNYQSNIYNKATELKVGKLNVKTDGYFFNEDNSSLSIGYLFNEIDGGDIYSDIEQFDSKISVRNFKSGYSSIDVKNTKLDINAQNYVSFLNTRLNITNSDASFTGKRFINDYNRPQRGDLTYISLDNSQLKLKFTDSVKIYNEITGVGNLDIETKLLKNGNESNYGEIEIKDGLKSTRAPKGYGYITIKADDVVVDNSKISAYTKTTLTADSLEIKNEGDISGKATDPESVTLNLKKNLDEDALIYLPQTFMLNGKIINRD